MARSKEKKNQNVLPSLVDVTCVCRARKTCMAQPPEPRALRSILKHRLQYLHPGEHEYDGVHDDSRHASSSDSTVPAVPQIPRRAVRFSIIAAANRDNATRVVTAVPVHQAAAATATTTTTPDEKATAVNSTFEWLEFEASHVQPRVPAVLCATALDRVLHALPAATSDRGTFAFVVDLRDMREQDCFQVCIRAGFLHQDRKTWLPWPAYWLPVHNAETTNDSHPIVQLSLGCHVRVRDQTNALLTTSWFCVAKPVPDPRHGPAIPFVHVTEPFARQHGFPLHFQLQWHTRTTTRTPVVEPVQVQPPIPSAASPPPVTTCEAQAQPPPITRSTLLTQPVTNGDGDIHAITMEPEAGRCATACWSCPRK